MLVSLWDTLRLASYHDLQAPFPEEFNRQVVGRVTRWHFAPTEQSCQNLLAERVPSENIHVTGNTVIDSLFWVLKRLDEDPKRKIKIESFLKRQLFFPWQTQRFVLITGHRRENFGQGFLQICEALRLLAHSFPEVHFVYPVHLNPAVQQPVFELLQALPNVHLLPPLEYDPFCSCSIDPILYLPTVVGFRRKLPAWVNLCWLCEK